MRGDRGSKMPADPARDQPGVRIRRRIPHLLAAGVAVVGVGYLSAFLPGGAPGWSAAAVVAGTAVSLAAGMALGMGDDDGIVRLLPVLAFVVVVVAGGLGALLVLPPTDPADPTLVLGLPPRAALLLYGVGLLPVLVVPLAYAWSFRTTGEGPDAPSRTREPPPHEGEEASE